MAVVERRRKRGTVYYVCTSVKGAKHWEKVGTNKREAETLDRQRRREVKEGTFRPGQATAQMLVETFGRRWLETRKNRTAHNDARLLEIHVFTVAWFAKLPIGDVRPKHFPKLAGELLAAGKLGSKSISLVMGLVRVLFRDAALEDVIEANPYVMPRGLLKRSGKKREPYTATEAVALLTAPKDALWRAWNHAAFYTGQRCGELCGLRWGDWDDMPKPLGSLLCERQYDGQALKTDRPRIVPVHPELRAALLVWREQWAAMFCREPEPNDLIFPAPDGQAFSKSSVYKAWLRGCKAAEVTNRSVHSTRHTFITFARRGGANREVVELITHNPKGTIVDRYTTRDWAELCEAVLAVRYVDAPVDAATKSSGFKGSSSWTRTSSTSENREKTWSAQETARSENTERSAVRRHGDARVDASQLELAPATWALAYAANDVLRRAG